MNEECRIEAAESAYDPYSYGSPVDFSQSLPEAKKQRDIGELLRAATTAITDLNLSDVQARKHYLNNHRMCGALYEVLSEIKQNPADLVRKKEYAAIFDVEDPLFPELLRLEKMLEAEGIASSEGGECAISENIIENAEYREKLEKIRKVYHAILADYKKLANDFRENVNVMLRQQSSVRPICPREVETIVRMVDKKFANVGMLLKQNTCEAVMMLKSRFLDARRKRRNFSKKASEILNEYFYQHLSNPYPSDEAKEELAKKCGITPSQVSNWFGNKRIRYKKNIPKAEEEANMYAAKKAAEILGARGSIVSPKPSGQSRDNRTATANYGITVQNGQFESGCDMRREIASQFPSIRKSRDSDSDQEADEKRRRI